MIPRPLTARRVDQQTLALQDARFSQAERVGWAKAHLLGAALEHAAIGPRLPAALLDH